MTRGLIVTCLVAATLLPQFGCGGERERPTAGAGPTSTGLEQPGAASQPAGDADDWDLAILTPHNDQIQLEFEQAFSKYMGRTLRIRWIKQGTRQLMRVLDATAVEGQSFGFDIFFGGGVPDHDEAAAKGYLEKIDLPAETRAAIPPEIAGVANLDANGMWYGSALSAFGIVVCKKGLDNQKFPPIESWQDLADPRMSTWVIIADPRKSSSVGVAYELVLQQYGWEAGWPLLMQMAANARQVSASASQIPNEVALGNVLAGPCIDFYARARIHDNDAGVLEYVNPAGGTAITPDPISILRNPPHPALARKFVEFVLSSAGQALWALPPGEEHGPIKHALFRMPIRPDVYEKYGDKLMATNPYERAGTTYLKIDDRLQNARTRLVAELMGAALVDQHDDLVQAWQALVRAGDSRVAAWEEWRKLPFSEAEGLELAKVLAQGGEAGSATDRRIRGLKREWIGFFHQKYERVIELSR